jgi:large subunit ribosomal protein L30
MTTLKVRQVRSGVGGQQNQRATLRTLGLKRIGDESLREDRPEVRGMIKTVAHLVTVEEVETR